MGEAVTSAQNIKNNLYKNMSSHGHGGGDAWSHLKWLIFALIVLWFVWFFTGGPQRYESQSGKFIKPPAPLNTGKPY
jgi:hypothetical protein